MYSESSQTNLVIITRRDRFRYFCKLYWRIIVILFSPIFLLPVALISKKNAYSCFYVFLVLAVYWIADVLHPSIIALMPIGISSVMACMNKGFMDEIYIRNDVLDCLGVMMLAIAIEHSKVHRRVALKVLLIFGCSHYRLSFLLFFVSMFLSMWISTTLACGLMMPLVKAILTELEKMGILEIYQTIGKARQTSNRHEQDVPRPTDFTVFYFLGIAYSSSIGGMATVMGSQANQIFKIFCETIFLDGPKIEFPYFIIFPSGPKIEFPHFMLLNLPGVLVMETLLYMWMNFYFLGMFRSQSDIALEIGMTEEEAQYMDTLLAIQYQHLGPLKCHQIIVGTTVILAALLQATISTAYIIDHHTSLRFHSHLLASSPCIMCAVILFIVPTNLDFCKFFERRTVGSGTLFEALRDSEMTEEFEKFLALFRSWPLSALVFVVVVFCKVLSELAPNSSVVYSMLPGIAKLSVVCGVNPHYLMMAATLASSLPFHLVTGAPVNAMVSSYVYIPPWRMMYAGIGPSVIAVVVVWFTVSVWSTAVWTDIGLYPEWAHTNMFNIKTI